MVELNARFDEENNIEWSRRLEDAGCHVILYGLDGLKVHSKLCLITREDRKVRLNISHRSEPEIIMRKTAKLYTDLSLYDSASGRSVQEATEVFQQTLSRAG